MSDWADAYKWTLTKEEIEQAVSKMSEEDVAFLKELQKYGSANEVKWFVGMFHYFDPNSEEAAR